MSLVLVSLGVFLCLFGLLGLCVVIYLGFQIRKEREIYSKEKIIPCVVKIMASIVTDNNDNNNNNNNNDTINLRKQLTQELKKRRPNLFTIHEIIQKGEDIITPNLRPHLYCSLLRLEKTHIQRSTDALLKK